MSVLNDYRAIWGAALMRRSTRWIRMALGGIGLLVPVLLLVGAVFHTPWQKVWFFAVAAPGALLLLIWVFVFVPGAALMNTPANARLVPRMHRRLVEMIVGVWAIVFAVALFSPQWQVAPVVVAWVIGMSIARSGRPIGGLFGALAGATPLLSQMAPAGVADFMRTAPGFALACVVVVLLALYAISAILPNGGERHIGQRKGQTETIQKFESMGRSGTPAVGKSGRSLYLSVLRRATSAGEPARLLFHSLGPRSHWTSVLPGLALMLAIGIAASLVVPHVVAINRMASVGVWMLLLVLLLVFVGYVDQARQLGSTRSEQSLVRLAARSPGSGMFNHQLAGQLMRSVLFCWLSVSGAILALALLAGEGAMQLLILATLCSLLFFPGMAWVLRDYARADGNSSFIFSILAMLVLTPLSGAAYALQDVLPAIAWIGLALAGNAIAAVAVVRRWENMVAAPVAFPSGRLAA
jgi:hypothetical protein